MDSTRASRKVLPNYLLEDYIPVPDSKPSAAGASGSHVHADTQQLGEISGTRSENGVSPTPAADGAGEALGLLPRRKKLRQACIYCRRSHLVCEEKRPCHRCVKRGIADRCVDPPQEGKPADEAGQFNGSAEQKPHRASPASSNSEEDPSRTTAAASQSASGAQRGGKRKRKSLSRNAHSDRTVDSDRSQAPFSAAALAESTDRVEQSSFNAGATHRPIAPSTVPPIVPAAYANLPISMPMHVSAPAPVRSAPSQLLQGQPIFQPPSSAELDSLFSTYFFDVADAFNARPGTQHLCAPAHHTVAGQDAMFGPHHQAQHQHQQQQLQQQQHAQLMPNAQGQHQNGAGVHAAQHHLGGAVSGAHDQRMQRHAVSGENNQMGHQQRHQHPHAGLSAHDLSGRTSVDGEDKSLLDTPATSLLSNHAGGAGAGSDRMYHGAAEGKEPVARQRPGDVYAPYPYRKGYASLMRYMTEQNWSQQSICSVEAALSKIRRLWFSLEDNIQPSSMIQLQAEWAGNVRYYSESVLPFTPVPMVVCRKAGEVYASNQLAHELCGRSRDQMTGGKLSCYELMTEASASEFFRLYELAVGGGQAEDGSYVPAVGNTAPLYWNADIVRPNADGSVTVRPTRGVFEMKIAPCGLPSLLVCCFVPLD